MSGKIYWHFHFLSRNLLCCTIKKSSQHHNLFRKFNYYYYFMIIIQILFQSYRSRKRFQTFKKNLDSGMVDCLAVTEAVATSSKPKKLPTIIGQTKIDSLLVNIPLKMGMLLLYESFPVKKSHWTKAQWEDFVSITKAS